MQRTGRSLSGGGGRSSRSRCSGAISLSQCVSKGGESVSVSPSVSVVSIAIAESEERGGNGRVGRIRFARGEVWVRVVSGLVVVVSDVQRGQFAVLDAERAAAVVDVLTVKGLSTNKQRSHFGTTSSIVEIGTTAKIGESLQV